MGAIILFFPVYLLPKNNKVVGRESKDTRLCIFVSFVFIFALFLEAKEEGVSLVLGLELLLMRLFFGAGPIIVFEGAARCYREIAEHSASS